MPPPTEPATAITRAIRRYAGRARCSLHALEPQCNRLIIRHVWAEARSAPTQTASPPGAKHIYKRRKEPSNVPSPTPSNSTVTLCPLPRAACRLPASACRLRRPEHQENRSRPRSRRSWPDSTPRHRLPTNQNKTPPKIAGFVRVWKPLRGLFCFHTRYSRSMCSIEPWRAFARLKISRFGSGVDAPSRNDDVYCARRAVRTECRPSRPAHIAEEFKWVPSSASSARRQRRLCYLANAAPATRGRGS